MNDPAAAPSTFDKAKAVELGQLLQAVYGMYKEGDLEPAPSGIPAGYKFVAWVQMQDFSLGSSPFEFYGIVAQETARPNHYVVAIRGTQGDIEWFDDLTSVDPAPWAGGGQVGFGFGKIYGTLRIVDPEAQDHTMGERLAGSEGGFAAQVERVTQRHHMATARAGAPAPVQVSAVGHSLGAALATLYVSDNHRARYANASLLCTFASPFVGDSAFAQNFNALGILSWRIVNGPDLVPKLPPLEYQHVEAAVPIDSSGETVISLFDPARMIGCWHSLQTYLHMLEPSLPLEAACVREPSILAARRMALAPKPPSSVSLDVPRKEGGTTINITVNVGGPG